MRKTTDLEKRVFEYLNDLRNSGITNMFGATPYIESKFPEVTPVQSRKLLTCWMKNFNEEGNYDEVKDE